MDVLRDRFLGFTLPLSCFVIFICSGTQGVLLCSQCASGPNGTCVKSPPSATKCPHTTSNNVNCMTTKRYDHNETMIEFIRGCTMVGVGKGCVEQNNNFTLCYEVCHSDNCNHASSFSIPSAIVLISFVFILLKPL